MMMILSWLYCVLFCAMWCFVVRWREVGEVVVGRKKGGGGGLADDELLFLPSFFFLYRVLVCGSCGDFWGGL